MNIVSSRPSDVSFLNPRSANAQAVSNQILKGMLFRNAHGVTIAETNTLHAVFWEQNGAGNPSATAMVYDPTECLSLQVMVSGCKDTARAKTILLRTLGGMTLPAHKLSVEATREGIREILRIHSVNGVDDGAPNR